MVTPEVTEVDGVQLHLSAANPTGYLGLQVVDGARFRARYGQKHIGTYGTAVEAAVAYAKAVAAAENGDEEGEGERPSSSATGEEEEGGEGAAEERPERAEGFDLETSSRNSTGYRGVFLSHGKFEARHKSKYIGHFETAVQAAVAYAKAKAAAEEEGGWLESGSEWLQRRVATRHGDGVVSGGTLTKWVPADGEDEALWLHGARRRRRRGLGRGGGRGRAQAVRGGEPGAGRRRAAEAEGRGRGRRRRWRR